MLSMFKNWLLQQYGIDAPNELTKEDFNELYEEFIKENRLE